MSQVPWGGVASRWNARDSVRAEWSANQLCAMLFSHVKGAAREIPSESIVITALPLATCFDGHVARWRLTSFGVTARRVFLRVWRPV
jgi:hypothetical protein